MVKSSGEQMHSDRAIHFCQKTKAMFGWALRQSLRLVKRLLKLARRQCQTSPQCAAGRRACR
ncbi:transposase [Ideonella paludis]|uniref:Transposase n=1 Tax=Ideonella paludis TaxID=1233411 RepID=A0ABS5E3B3_9BURK|nr:transposase [Ideonella paludis]